MERGDSLASEVAKSELELEECRKWGSGGGPIAPILRFRLDENGGGGCKAGEVLPVVDEVGNEKDRELNTASDSSDVTVSEFLLLGVKSRLVGECVPRCTD